MPLIERFQRGKSEIEQKLEAGRARHRAFQPTWAECLAFTQNRQFVWRNRNGTLSELRTEPDQKEWYRSRLVRNHIFPIVNAEVSAGTSRTPGYEVVPSTTEQEDIDAAKVSEQVLVHLYELLSLRRKLVNVYRYAVVCGEGFLRPYWNPKVGRPLPQRDEQDEQLFEGEVAVEVLGPDAVFWEPGLSFDESPWHAIERAMPPERVAKLPGFKGDPKELKADSAAHGSFIQSQLSKKNAKADSILVTEWLEKPSSETQGRRVYLANGKEITDPEGYPHLVEGPDGPEPCLLKLSYIETPDRDRDMGLVEQLLDAQRTLNDALNKQVEWKNLALNPQGITGPGGMIDALTNEPGAIFRVKGDPNAFQWRPVPPIPPELQGMKEDAASDMELIAAQRSVPSQVESGKAIAALLEKDQSVRGHIVQNLADFNARLGKHLLALVQRYYTEQRLIQVNGRLGWEYVSFKGADLKGQIDVRVLPGSIEPRTKESVKQELFNLAQLFPGWLTPEKFHAALNGGSAEKLIDSYNQHVGRASRVIQKLREGPEALFTAWSPRIDAGRSPEDPANPADAYDRALLLEQTWRGSVGQQPMEPIGLPGWMPRPFDALPIHKAIFEDWFVSPDFERQTHDMQEAAQVYYLALQELEAQQAQREAELQNLMAEQQGMQNAAKPQLAKPMPSMPSVNGT